MAATYLDKPKQWDAMVKLCRDAGVFGLDSEFYNVDPSKQSCYGRAKVHVWSVAIRTERMGPRGYRDCVGWCLPAAALDYPPIRELLEDASIKKEVHNEPVDKHSFRNHGIVLRGARDTLSYVKWQKPELINTPGRFKLKNLMSVMLGKQPVCTFKQLVADERQEQVPFTKKKTLKGCSCGTPRCKKRKPEPIYKGKRLVGLEEHTRWNKVVETEAFKLKLVKFKWPLQDIKPCGKRDWQTCPCALCVKFRLLVDYAIEDAVCALQVAEIADEAKNPAPFPYGGQRPGYSQAVIEAVIQMEQTGFPRDKEFCIKQAEVAGEDEQAILNWLYKWYVVNSDTYGPHGRRLKTKITKAGRESVSSGTDGIWSSVAKKIRLFERLGFPRSPVWAKGKTKGDKVKLDHVAMKWIGANHAPAKQLVDKLLLLGRIRNGKKYLVKLRDADDIVHPICGPAGDEDERSGAVTGRLGIKGELEAQQLPKPGDKDLYQVRRAIIA